MFSVLTMVLSNLNLNEFKLICLKLILLLLNSISLSLVNFQEILKFPLQYTQLLQ
jgi:hypothetical protein